ncbi:hypothetical protein [Legionella rowbothamii]|uniref:hypothetical protein n=1 Tax=Legionella rowbothamii TaxID=96229 RepID=UPI0010546464|nr:hypothetical protein [Legionella rowbothamii]
MIYNVVARKRLSVFVSKVNSIIDSHRLNGNSTQSADDIQTVANQALTLFHAYYQPEVREDSAQARLEYLDELLTSLRSYNTHISNGKTWWQKIMGFFGFLPPEEKYAQGAMRLLKDAHAHALIDYNDVHYPNWLFRLARFFGLQSVRQFLADKYDSYPSQFKLTYLSHHLMGKTDLNHHAVLQGKVSSCAYHDFANDLDEFIKREGSHLDEQTRTQLESIKDKVRQSSELANEIDKASIISHLNIGVSDVVDGLIFDVTYQIHKTMMRLQPGSSFIIPCGFKSTKGGHATVVECCCVAEDRFVFRVINTGAGETDIESWKTLFVTSISGSMARPIKVTDPMPIQEVMERKLIEKIVKPTIVSSADSSGAMNEEFLTLYREGKLHDDKQHLTLQTNGTCSHSSLLEWFKAQVPGPVFALFQHATIARAHQRLQDFNDNDQWFGFSTEVSKALVALHSAAEHTVVEARDDLAMVTKQMQEERAMLCSELDVFLKSKKTEVRKSVRRDVHTINDFDDYSRKKCKGNKLIAAQQERVVLAKSLAPLASTIKISRSGVSGLLLGNASMPEKTEARTRKAIIAKQIAGHDRFLAVANLS